MPMVPLIVSVGNRSATATPMLAVACGKQPLGVANVGTPSDEVGRDADLQGNGRLRDRLRLRQERDQRRRLAAGQHAQPVEAGLERGLQRRQLGFRSRQLRLGADHVETSAGAGLVLGARQVERVALRPQLLTSDIDAALQTANVDVGARHLAN